MSAAALSETRMAHAIRVNEAGGPEALSWDEVEVGQPGPGEARIRQAPNAAEAHRALEARKTTGSTILTV